MDFKYTASVIVPVYNVEKYLRKCLDSLVEQTMDKADFEILVINDGSTDNSWDICLEYSEQHDNIKAFSKENEGLSATRNFGILNAKGKYLFFLDSDDWFTPDTVKKVTDFFNKVYDEVDMVAYNEVRFKGKEILKPHFRFEILDREGVYDLNSYPYITQTRVNICVKNMDDYNILFNTTPGFRLEDQEYCNRVLMPKMKLGYCPSGTYMYNKGNESSIMSVYFHAYYLFKTSMEYFEGLFDAFPDRVPEYFQSIFVNDLRWRLKDDILLPYQYEGKAYDDSLDRIRSLLKRVDDKIILDYPDCAEMNKQFFLNLKYDGQLSFENEGKLRLKNGDTTVFEAEEIGLVIDRFKFKKNTLEVCGHLSSPVLLYAAKPQLLLRKRNKSESVELFESSFCCDNANVKNNQAWGFRLEIDTSEDLTFGFALLIDDKACELKISSGHWVAINKEIGRNTAVIGTKECRFTEKRITIKNTDGKAQLKYSLKSAIGYLKKNRKVFVVRLINLLMTLVMPKKKMWLYSDNNTLDKGNAYLQFLHDSKINDGVDRYYVIDGKYDVKCGWFDDSLKKKLLAFRSNKHKLLYLRADKIITSSSDTLSYLPFFDDIYKFYMDLFEGEVVCLGTGVFNTHLPWKYSYDRLDVDKRVISTEFEEKLLTESYAYPEKSLIRSKMPRYDLLNKNGIGKKKILYAPSWRKYLIGQKGDGKWVPAEKRFADSEYYRETVKLLGNPELHKMLDENNMCLDIKLHPVFGCYSNCFEFSNSRVKTVDEIDFGDYDILITDYSSIAFDYVYLKRPIVCFVPDYDKFKAGMDSCRRLEMPLEEGFGELTFNAESAVAALGRIIENDGNILPPFVEKYSDFFFDTDKTGMDTIYQSLTTE